jgi:poly-beta-1,6-N-acetyl-D-glucosamine synthase
MDAVDNSGVRYVLVTPVRNEELTIERVITSVRAQTVQPAEWVIVSDESTDRTDEIVRRHAAECPIIHLVRLANRPKRNFASVVFATQAGVDALKVSDYKFIGLLDADVSFASDYYERILDQFAREPELGIAGGLVVDVGHRAARLGVNCQSLREVAGAVQCFRRACFESLGGLVAIPEGGWDAITCLRARMNGFKTATFADLRVDHLKPRNSAEGGAWRRRWQLGVRDYALGMHPLFAVAKYLGRTIEWPLLFGAMARLSGYCSAALQRRERRVPAEVIQYARREQLRRLLLLPQAASSPPSPPHGREPRGRPSTRPG